MTGVSALWRNVRSIDGLFGAVALAFGLPSLAYPLGRDQGLYFYVAREWLERDKILYLDSFDHKPPIIHFIYSIVLTIFGKNTWGIRVLELFVAVPLLAWLVARVVSTGRPNWRGTFGAVWLGISIIHYGYFEFWETGQCEIWYTIFSFAALVVVSQWKHVARAQYLSGVLSGLALVTKPAALPLITICVGAMILRKRREQPAAGFPVRPLCRFSAGAAALPIALVLWFANHGALASMWDILVRANLDFVATQRRAHSVSDR